MITIDHEYFVSLEIAKLLKEAGFNWKVRYMYRNNNPTLCICTESPYRNVPKLNKCPMYWQYAAPTLDIAQRWLRETQKYQVAILPNGLKGYTALCFLYKEPITQPFEYYSTYEEALEISIKKTLEIILEKEK